MSCQGSRCLVGAGKTLEGVLGTSLLSDSPATAITWEFPKIIPYLGVLIIRILLFRVLY